VKKPKMQPSNSLNSSKYSYIHSLTARRKSIENYSHKHSSSTAQTNRRGS